ncbi:alkaline phosphatase family protein [Deinococcus roseus]|uniref:Phosphodiesterase n=1 Tax=Deinococcus roseus TaxID=392414 RepID=A0ABQ2CTH2_9DEIO|nr:alkaline phosphatase family protein [Deinococcus roseus]GGJ19267.1 phosphodiesterase [Deinococcus roseus]
MTLLSNTLRPDLLGGSILNLISSIQQHFGLNPPDAPLRDPIPFQKKVVLFIADGLGQQQILRHTQQQDTTILQHFSEHRTLTSVFPSATMAALTTLHMGAPPARTGWLSGCLWLPELGSIVNLVHQRDEFTRQVVNVGFMRKTRSVYRQLQSVGVKSTVIFPAAFLGSFLSGWHHEGAHQEGFYFTPNTIPTLVSAALQHSNYVVVYYPHFDDMCHRFNPESQEASDEMLGLDGILQRTIRRLPDNTTFLLTADHGHKSIVQNVWLDQQPDLQPHLVRPVSGEKVARYVHVKPGHAQEVQDLLSQWADVVPTTQLWEEGYFGGDPAELSFLDRTGDLLAHARSGTELNWNYHPDTHQLKGWLGNHGGLTETEMRVPLGVLHT